MEAHPAAPGRIGGDAKVAADAMRRSAVVYSSALRRGGGGAWRKLAVGGAVAAAGRMDDNLVVSRSLIGKTDQLFGPTDSADQACLPVPLRLRLAQIDSRASGRVGVRAKRVGESVTRLSSRLSQISRPRPRPFHPERCSAAPKRALHDRREE